jgi:hypothetical protein
MERYKQRESAEDQDEDYYGQENPNEDDEEEEYIDMGDDIQPFSMNFKPASSTSKGSYYPETINNA